MEPGELPPTRLRGWWSEARFTHYMQLGSSCQGHRGGADAENFLVATKRPELAEKELIVAPLRGPRVRAGGTWAGGRCALPGSFGPCPRLPAWAPERGWLPQRPGLTPRSSPLHRNRVVERCPRPRWPGAAAEVGSTSPGCAGGPPRLRGDRFPPGSRERYRIEDGGGQRVGQPRRPYMPCFATRGSKRYKPPPPPLCKT